VLRLKVGVQNLLRRSSRLLSHRVRKCPLPELLERGLGAPGQRKSTRLRREPGPCGQPDPPRRKIAPSWGFLLTATAPLLSCILTFLAYAEGGDSSESNLVVVLICAGIIAAVGLAGLIPVLVARSRRHRYREAIVLMSVVWGVLAAGSLTSTAIAQLKWSKERMLRIESGYYDPRDITDAPPLPWWTWSLLALGYCGLWIGAMAQRSPPGVTPPAAR